MSKICVIGAGASGIIASLILSKNNEVILLDRNNKIGKKILLTGNGRCNYFNSDININNYNTDNKDNLEMILNYKEEVLEYLTNLGIYPKIKNNYYYPNSNQASSVVTLFNNCLEKSNVLLKLEYDVVDIIKEDKFIIKTNKEDIICDKVVIACGGCSYPKTGSDGSIFKILNKYHTVNNLYPSLVPLKLDYKYLKEWNNVRVEAKVDLIIDNNIIDTEIGEVQLTDYGISGIPIFNLSGKYVRNINKNIILKIDFLNEENNILDLLEKKNNNDTIEDIFETIIPYQLLDSLLKSINVNKDILWNNLDNSLKEKIVRTVKEFEVDVIGVLDYDRSQVTSGGVSLSEINPKAMESLKVKDLYLIGEVLDVDGKCGGFNLGFSFISGYIVGVTNV